MIVFYDSTNPQEGVAIAETLEKTDAIYIDTAEGFRNLGKIMGIRCVPGSLVDGLLQVTHFSLAREYRLKKHRKTVFITAKSTDYLRKQKKNDIVWHTERHGYGHYIVTTFDTTEYLWSIRFEPPGFRHGGSLIRTRRILTCNSTSATKQW